MDLTTNPWGRLLHADGVHGSVYVDREIYAAELQRIWRRTWVYVGHESEVPRRHDFVMKCLGPEPVIMTRDAEGRVRLLLNRCSHRGNQVCTQPRGNLARARGGGDELHQVSGLPSAAAARARHAR